MRLQHLLYKVTRMPGKTWFFGRGVSNYGGVEAPDHQLQGCRTSKFRTMGVSRWYLEKSKIFSGAVGARENFLVYKTHIHGRVLISAIRKCNKNEPYIKGKQVRRYPKNFRSRHLRKIGGVELDFHQLWGVSNLPITNYGGCRTSKSRTTGVSNLVFSGIRVILYYNQNEYNNIIEYIFQDFGLLCPSRTPKMYLKPSK